MASGRMEFHANSIMQHANFSFVLANDVSMEEVHDKSHYDREPYNLILLHGLTGTDTDWLYGGVAHRLSIQYNLNIFMPATGPTFYLDKGYEGANHCTYVGEELPEYIANTFRLRLRRENTLIGGLSMGGFGALHTALTYPDRFSGCIALSSALVVNDVAEGTLAKENSVMPVEMLKDIFGDPSELKGSDADLEHLYMKAKAAGADIPRIYMACGTEDSLIGTNRKFRDFLTENGALNGRDLIYEEGPGKHHWDFWNEYIDRGAAKLLKAKNS